MFNFCVTHPYLTQRGDRNKENVLLFVQIEAECWLTWPVEVFIFLQVINCKFPATPSLQMTPN